MSPSPTPVLSPAPSPAADNNVEKDVKVSTVNRTETVVQTSQKEIDMWSGILLDLGITFQIYDDFVGSFGQEKSIEKNSCQCFLIME